MHLYSTKFYYIHFLFSINVQKYLPYKFFYSLPGKQWGKGNAKYHLLTRSTFAKILILKKFPPIASNKEKTVYMINAQYTQQSSEILVDIFRLKWKFVEEMNKKTRHTLNRKISSQKFRSTRKLQFCEFKNFTTQVPNFLMHAGE